MGLLTGGGQRGVQLRLRAHEGAGCARADSNQGSRAIGSWSVRTDASPVAVTGSPFCEHKKLRTGCAICKAAGRAMPEPTLATTPYVTQDERDEKREKTRKAGTPGGPGKPLLPKRTQKNRVTAEDEARAQAWWVKK